ncbi:glycerate kinase [Singulisphaera sp. PoT]|uniref:glycerate kinase n=1 Tax=Singulisphaera sp. PoT TaxID=3411797 RepID=UPI003BF519C1
MRVVVAPDKFKGSLTAPVAAKAIARGVRNALPGVQIDEVPMADGGEGTVDALVSATQGRFHEVDVTGPLGEPVRARFGMLGDAKTAVIEMASASGLVLVPRDRRDPSRTTTRGTGELVLAAISAGARRLIIGIGGSATNDGGAGFGQALGYRLIDAKGEEIGPGGGDLARLDRIDPSRRDPRLEGVEIAVACDVDNPLCGPRGASAIYGPQKGADPALIGRLDANLGHLARLVERDLGQNVRDVPGAGAAGGLGAGMMAFASGKLEPGVTLILNAVNLADRLEGADLCLTGEGGLDGSSVYGKTPVGVGRLARSLGCPAFALVGSLGAGAEGVLDHGIDAYFSICPAPCSLDEAIEHAEAFLEKTAEQAMRAFLAGRRVNLGTRP